MLFCLLGMAPSPQVLALPWAALFFLPGPTHTAHRTPHAAQAARNKGCWRFFKGFWRNLLLKKQA
jgi:hypothetical protein